MRVLDLALKDLVQTFRDHKSALFLVLMPLVFTVFIGLIFRFGPSDPRLPVGLVVEDGAEAPLVGVLVGLLEASEGIRVEMLDAAADLEEAVRDQDLAGGLVVPAGLSEAALRGEAPQLRGIVRPTDPAGTAVQAEFEAVASRLQAIAETARLAADAYEERRALPARPSASILDEAVSGRRRLGPPAPAPRRDRRARRASTRPVGSSSLPGDHGPVRGIGLISSASALVVSATRARRAACFHADPPLEIVGRPGSCRPSCNWRSWYSGQRPGALPVRARGDLVRIAARLARPGLLSAPGLRRWTRW